MAGLIKAEDIAAAKDRVNIEDGAFQCLACGAHGGDVYQFVKLLENLSFPDAKKRVAQLIGLTEGTEIQPQAPTRRRPGRRGYVPKYKREAH